MEQIKCKGYGYDISYLIGALPTLIIEKPCFLLVLLFSLWGGSDRFAFAQIYNGGDKESLVELTQQFVNAIKKYEKLGSFNEGLAAVMRDGRWGYINTKGDEVITCQFPDPYIDYIASSFYEGMAPVLKDNNWGYINKKGEEVIPISIEAEAVGRFSEGLAFVYIDEENFSVIDKKGGIVFSGKSDFSWYFGPEISSELLPVYHQGNICVPLEPDNFAVFDKQGNKVREIDQDAKDVLDKQNEKKPYTAFLKENGENEDNQYFTVGLKDPNGKEIIPAIYDGIGNVGAGEIIDAPNGVVLVVLDEIGEDVIKGYGDELDSPDSKRHYGYADLKGHNTFSDDIIEKCGRTKDIALLKIKKQKEEEFQKANNANQSQESIHYNTIAFNTNQDFINYFSTPKRYKGRGPIFDGIIELKGNGVSEISVYVNDHYLSPLGLINPNQKHLFGDYAKMYVYDGGRAYPLIIHLPDDNHPYEYIYFEPLKTSTDRNLALALHLPISEGWLWVEPDVQNNKGTLIWHTDDVSKPSPIIYKRIDSK